MLLSACSGGPGAIYRDPRAGVDRRAEDLLRRMTPEEKRDLVKTGHANPRLGIPALNLQTIAPASGLALAATWNPDIVSKVAANANSGFGAYGDDPWLASRMAVAWISGAQGAGKLSAMTGMPCAAEDARVSNEILFPPFRAAVEEAGVWAVASECKDHRELYDWGFRGFVVGSGETDDDSVRRVLRALFGAGLFDEKPKAADAAEIARTARLASEQGVVLLENQDGLLPLYATKIHSIGVVGPEALLNAVRVRAGATAVIAGDGADVVIESKPGEPVTVRDRKREALLEAWGDAQAATDAIFGDANPSGKLPVSREPKYPFGFGLSYTTFEWTDLRIFPASPRYGQTVQVVVRVRNTGQAPGADVIELYIHQAKPSVERPPKELKAFTRVELKAGEARDVAMTLDRRSLSFYDPALHDWAAEPGVFEVLLGSSSREVRLKGSLELYP